jgi:hypothetical protein
MIKTVAAIFLTGVLSFSTACAAESIDTDYNGPDAGTLIFSTSTLQISMNFTFYYERSGDDRDADSIFGAGEIVCSCVGFWHPKMSDPDFDTGYETGKVHIQHLRPGNYEVYTLTFGGFTGVSGLQWFPKKGFSLPFTIKPGQATYIGNFARHPSLATPLEAQLGATGYFVVSDRSARDIEIARKQDPALPPVQMSVTDVGALNLPNLLPQDIYGPKVH